MNDTVNISGKCPYDKVDIPGLNFAKLSVRVDLARIEQVIRNLLSNAAKVYKDILSIILSICIFREAYKHIFKLAFVHTYICLHLCLYIYINTYCITTNY